MNNAMITELVNEVIAQLSTDGKVSIDGINDKLNSGRMHGVFSTVDDDVSAAHTAHLTLVAMPLEKRKEIIANIRKRCAEQVRLLSEIAVLLDLLTYLH